MTIFLMFILNQFLFAHGAAEIRANCSNGSKFRSLARASCGLPTQTVSKSCTIKTFAYANAGSGPKVWQCAESGPTTPPRVWGASYSWRCTGGGPLSDLYLSTDDFTDSSGSEGHNVYTGTIDFNSTIKTITLNDISGYLNNSFHYLETQFSITVWLPSSSNDSTITPGKTKWVGTINILNGVVTSSNFTAGVDYNSTTDSGRTVYLTGMDKVIDLSMLSNNDFGNLCVNVTVHTVDNVNNFGNFLAGVNENRLIENNVKFTINKTKNENSYQLIFDDNFSKCLKLEIFDINGKRIYSENLKIDEVIQIVKVFNMVCSSTIIFARIETEDKKVYYKKFSIQ